MNRLYQGILIVSTILGSWLGMQAVHELGHVIGARLTGGQVERVVLDPRTISRTDLSFNPRPLVVVWAGPLIGVLLPLIIWGIVARLSGAFLFRFFAGFCLIANGGYISGGSFEALGDCREMLRQGSAIWTLWLFGAVTVPAGLWLWHRQGIHFGFGPGKLPVNPRIALGSFCVCLALLTLALMVDGN